jgi:hypothetical protein
MVPLQTTRTTRGAGWSTFSSALLLIAGIFGVTQGLMAVYRARFFNSGAVFVFSNLHTWGWIVFGLGVASFIAGLGTLTRNPAARRAGIGIAGVVAIGQMMFAQAYPFWTGLVIAANFMAIYGLAAYGQREEAAAAASGATETRAERPLEAAERDRRAA